MFSIRSRVYLRESYAYKDGANAMKVSTKGRYSLRLMIDIAQQGPAGTLVTMRQAAEREGLSVKYLEQLGGMLVRAGLLKSVRGVSGGYMLARPAQDITAREILIATEGAVHLATKADALDCGGAAEAAALVFWDGLDSAICEYAEKYSLEDLANLK